MNMEKRLARVERQNRIYRNLFILVGLAVVALLTYGATKPIPEAIRAHAFHVLNRDGRLVATVGAETAGGYLILYKGTEPEFQPFVVARILKDFGGYIQVSGTEGESHVSISGNADDKNGGHMRIKNKTGETVVQLEVDEYGNGVVGAYNRKGKGRKLKPGPR